MSYSLRNVRWSLLSVLGVLLLACFGLEYWLHLGYGVTNVYPHLFYIPIVMAAFYWGLKGALATAVLLSVMHAFSYLYFNDVTGLWRSLVLISLGTAAGLVSDRCKQAKKKMKDATALLHSIMGTATDEFIIIATDTKGTILYWNEGAKRLLGYESEEVVGKETVRIFHTPEYLKSGRIDSNIQSTIAIGKPQVEELSYVTKDDRTIPVIQVMTARLDEDGKFIGTLGLAHDITERKRAEKALRESEECYRELFDNMSCGVAVYEATGDGSDFVFKDLNRAAEQIDKIEKADIIGRSVLDMFPGVREYGLFDVFKRVWKTGKPEHHPVSLYKDERIVGWWESYVYKLSSGEIVAIYDDITEHKQAEEILHISENRYKLCTTAGQVGVWDWDLKTNSIYIDPHLKGMLGFDDNEIRNHLDDWGKRVHPDDAELVMAEVNEHLKGLTPTYEVAHRMLHKDGNSRWFLARGTAVRDATGKPIRMMGTDTDITERKLVEEALGKARQREASQKVQLMHSDRLSTVGRLAAGVAHEINNPLAVLYGTIQGIKTDPVKTNAIGESSVDRMLRVSHRIKSIVENLLTFARQETGEKSFSDINDIISETVSLVSSDLVKRNIELSKRMSENMPEIRVDRQQIQQVFLNFVFNAVDAMPEGGELVISTHVDNDQIVISFQDTGCGISRQDQDRLFSPFFTTKKVGNGTGLGLSINYGIIRGHGGRIELESESSKGAKFTIYLPIGGDNPEKQEL